MHPSNNLLLPILRKHGDRLLKAQIEAMVKELSWEEQEKFLGQQWDAATDEVREKLSKSYPDNFFSTKWDPELLKKGLKVWILALSGELNYFIGVDDFSITLTFYELGTPIFLIAFDAARNSEIYVAETKMVRLNGYKIKVANRDKSVPNDYLRVSPTGHELRDWILSISGRAKVNEEFKNPIFSYTLNQLAK